MRWTIFVWRRGTMMLIVRVRVRYPGLNLFLAGVYPLIDTVRYIVVEFSFLLVIYCFFIHFRFTQ